MEGGGNEVDTEEWGRFELEKVASGMPQEMALVRSLVGMWPWGQDVRLYL